MKDSRRLRRLLHYQYYLMRINDMMQPNFIMDGNMNVTKKQVFLISGQKKLATDSAITMDGEVSQCVVVASDPDAAFALLREQDSSFMPIGHATLEDYESAAAKLRSALRGQDVGIPVYISAALSA